MTSVSVAMATYNGAAYIRQQLDSIAAQRVLPNELVVTDDGSSDDTVSIVRKFALDAPFPVRVHQNASRLGYRANFMHNVSLCQSDLIAFCDQDDVWSPRKIERLQSSFSDPDVLLSFHESWLITEEGERTGLANIFPLPAANPPCSIFSLLNPFGFSIMFRRSLLGFSDLWAESVDSFETTNRMAHDQWVFFLASALGTVLFVDEPLASYRQHGSNTHGLSSRLNRPKNDIAHWIAEGSERVLSFGAALGGRARILEMAQAGLSGAWLERACAAARTYREMEANFALRSKLYSEARFVGRVKAWLEAVQAGTYYNKNRWSVGRKLALQDLLSTIVPRNFVARKGQKEHQEQLARSQDFRPAPADQAD